MTGASWRFVAWTISEEFDSPVSQHGSARPRMCLLQPVANPVRQLFGAGRLASKPAVTLHRHAWRLQLFQISFCVLMAKVAGCSDSVAGSQHQCTMRGPLPGRTLSAAEACCSGPRSPLADRADLEQARAKSHWKRADPAAANAGV